MEKKLILDRYEVLGRAGSGGFGTVEIAWDPRIQRKVAIKTIPLTSVDAYRASLPGAEAVAKKTPSAPVPSESDKEAESFQDQDTAEIPPIPEPSPAKDQSATRSLRDLPDPSTDLPSDSEELEEAEESDEEEDSTSASPSAEPWAGLTPWGEFVEAENARDAWAARDAYWEEREGPSENPEASSEPVRALAHLPGLDEARTAAMLSDPHIVGVYDFEVRDRTAYLIMEYIEGITLTRLLADYGDYLTLDMVAGVFDAVSEALMAAHKAGVLHLDIKPDNIIINGEGQAKVTDFGLATLADASGTGTCGGGTIGYMPPEQMERQHLDARTDEWALAAMTYEMLTGENPFRARNLDAARKAIDEAELVLPSLCWDDLDDQIDDVIFYALDPNPAERYGNVRDFAEETEKFLGDPDRGREQLALVVEDALGPEEPPEPVAPSAPSEEVKPERRGLFGWARSKRPQDTLQQPAAVSVPRFVQDPVFAEDPEEFEDEEDYEEDEEDYGYSRREIRRMRREARAAAREEHTPLAWRVPDGVAQTAGRVFGAIGSGFLGALALSNIPQLDALMVGGTYYGAGAGALIAAVIALLRPVLGAPVGFGLVAIALMISGHPVVGLVLIIATGLWFYVTGRESMADGNGALLGPLAGAIGLGAVVPFAVGSTLRPVQAGVTVAFCAVVACIFASFGSASLLGWDAFAHWSFADADITRTFARMIGRPLTWGVLGGWLVGSVGLSILSTGRHRYGLILGVCLCAVALMVGTLIFTAPTPQLFVAILLGAAGVVAAFL